MVECERCAYRTPRRDGRITKNHHCDTVPVHSYFFCKIKAPYYLDHGRTRRNITRDRRGVCEWRGLGFAAEDSRSLCCTRLCEVCVLLY